MKIFDCTLFYDEDLILEVRLNMLDKYVDKFIICESKYTHSGQKKKLNFDISKFSKFKNKIIYLTLDNEPDDLIYQKEDNSLFEKDINRRINSIKRIAHQRNKLMDGLTEANNDDFIFFIESWGQLQLTEMVSKAIDHIHQRFDEFSESLKKAK